MFRTLSNRAASTGSRLSIMAACDRVSGLAAAASRLFNAKSEKNVKRVYNNHIHCRCSRRGIASLFPLFQDRLISRRDGGGPQSGRGGASRTQKALGLETGSSGQTRHCTVLQPCKGRRPHGDGQFTPQLIESRRVEGALVFSKKKVRGSQERAT